MPSCPWFLRLREGVPGAVAFFSFFAACTIWVPGAVAQASDSGDAKQVLMTDLKEKDQAILASIKTDLRLLMTAEEAYFADKAMYTTFNRLESSGYAKLSSGNAIGAFDAGSANGYTISVRNDSASGGPIECVVYVGEDAKSAGQTDGVIKCYR